jgi:uncharacterized protein (TIGR03437 family)
MIERSGNMTYRCALAFLLAAVSYAQQQETVTYSYSGLPIAIFSDDADVISVAAITVPRALTITSVTARVQIDYPNSGDLKVYLYSPGGARTILLDNDCTTNGIDTTFDDAASGRWSDFCPAELGRGPFRGNEPLANMRSDPSSFGRWRLTVENDQSDSRTGWLTGFSVTITGTRQVSPTFAPETTVNAASRAGTAIAPGELVSIYGTSLGPTAAETAPAGALPTTLGGVTVTFDGTAVPIKYVSAYRVDVQAPFALQSGGQTTIRVTNGSNSSANVQVPVVSSAPGLFTTQPDGTGQVQAINQDGTLNSLTQAAPKGSIISVYASGLGAVNPPVTAGALPPDSPLSTTVASVTASIGGVPARVLYAGLAPGIPGSYQINIEVPADAPSGAQQLVISTNNVPSQDSARVQIQ